MMRIAVPATAALLALLPSPIEAHGIVASIQVQGGQTFKSPLIGASGDAGPFYVPSDNSPVTDVTSPDLHCGRVANKASSTPSIKAGSTLTYNWGSGYSNEQTAWPHEEGPMFWYITKCDDDCSKTADPQSGAKFFKVQQDGFASGGQWKQADLHAGKGVTFTIPSDLEEGNYLIRHEVINLASTAEMFPSCAQFKITGGSNKALSGASGSFPGAYKASDKGLAVAGAAVYEIKSDAGYVFPGPSLLSGLVSGGGNSGSNGGDSSSGKDDETSSAVPSGTKSPSRPAPTGVNNGAGKDSSSAPGPSPTESPSESEPTDGTPSSDSPASDPTSVSSDAPPSIPSAPSSGDISACGQAWTTCNLNYKPGKRGEYTCPQEYTSCVANSMKKNSSSSSTSSMKNAKRMHRLRRNVFHETH